MKRPDNTPERVDGWQGLADWLWGIGIETNAAALCERARRKDLPYRGGGVPGNTVRFEAGDLEVWVRDLRGMDLDLWVEQRRRDVKRGKEARGRPGANVRRRPRPWKALRAERQHVVLLRREEHGEELLRGRHGRIWVAGRRPEADTWPQAVVEAAAAVVCFGRVRAAIEADFHAGPAASPRTPSLLVACRMVESRLVTVPVPGTLFGLEASARTPTVVSPTHPRLADIRKSAEQEAPALSWFVWEDREDLDPVTLETVRSRKGAS